MREQALQEEVVEVLKSFDPLQDKTRESIEGALWALQEEQNRLDELEKEEDSPLTEDGTVVLLFAESQEKRPREFGLLLLELNFRVWPPPPSTKRTDHDREETGEAKKKGPARAKLLPEEEDPKGKEGKAEEEEDEGEEEEEEGEEEEKGGKEKKGQLRSLLEAIEKSSAIVLGLSPALEASLLCKTGARFGEKLGKKLVFVGTEEGRSSDPVPKGWLASLLPKQGWSNPWTHPRGFHFGFQEVLREILEASYPPEGLGAPFFLPSPAVSQEQERPLTGAYLHAVVPRKLGRLREEELQAGQVAKWGTGEVCRWLKMCSLDPLLRPFAWHRVTGPSLILWASMPLPQFRSIWDRFQIEQIGLDLEFRRHLEKLLFPDRPDPLAARAWGTEKIVAWLEKKNLAGISREVREGRWDGMLLHGLHHSLKRGSPPETCLGSLGVKAPLDQLRFVSALSELFGS